MRWPITRDEFLREVLRRAGHILSEALRRNSGCVELRLDEAYVRYNAFGERIDVERLAREIAEECS